MMMMQLLKNRSENFMKKSKRGDVMGHTYESIYEKVVKIVVDEFSVEESMIKKESNFMDDIGADSIEFIEMITKIEEEFDIEISDDQSEKIKTVDQAVKYVLKAKV